MINRISLFFLMNLLVSTSYAGYFATDNQTSTFGFDDVTSTTSAGTMACIDYQIEGGCVWLKCVLVACSLENSVRVSHRIPDIVVTVYDLPISAPQSSQATFPWTDLRTLIPELVNIGIPINYTLYQLTAPLLQSAYGADGFSSLVLSVGVADFLLRDGGVLRQSKAADTKQVKKNITTRKEAAVIGNPSAYIIYEIMNGTGFMCSARTTPWFPYFLSEVDPEWRYGALPLIDSILNPSQLMSKVYETALNAGGVPAYLALDQYWGIGKYNDMFGSAIPTVGEVPQENDYRAAAVLATRAAYLTSGYNSGYVELPLAYRAVFPIPYQHSNGKWDPLDPSMTNGEAANQSSKGWQMIHPKQEDSCHQFGHEITTPANDPYADKDQRADKGITDTGGSGYAWLLWQRYECCQRKGQTFITKY